MGEELYWSKLVTKALHAINGEDRFFEGYLTVEVKDKQGEITIVDELIKDELNKIEKKFLEWKKRTGDKSLDHVSFENAAKIFLDMITKENFDDFLTLPLYEKI